MQLTSYCELPTLYGTFRMYDTGNESLRVVTFGDINKLGSNPLVRLHSSCLASEVFAAQDCDCADQLRETMNVMAHDGSGIIFHLQQEGRGQGLSNKIQAIYKMKTEGLDTAESFQVMGLEQDVRDYSSAIKILQGICIKNIRLVSNNPRKRKALIQANIQVSTVNTHPKVRPENSDYLQSKNKKLNHSLPLDSITDPDSPIHFYHSDQMWGDFSNFSQHSIFIDGKIWRTAEHYYQSRKFSDVGLQERIRLAATAMQAKEVAKQLEEQHQIADWDKIKEVVMRLVLTVKFDQHPELKTVLLGTNQRHIAEHTTNDQYWGDGVNGAGLNRLGELLMQLRAQLQASDEGNICVV